MKICKRCILDEQVPQIEFNKKGICNYCELHDNLSKAFPNDIEKGKPILEAMFNNFKKKQKGNKYDCIIGVSGGVDSIYLLHIAKSYGLNPLAVHIDNGWDTEISKNNIKNILEKLSVDLYTYSIDWEDMKDVLKSFLKASYPWADGPTDIALLSALYKVAKQHNVRNILVGNNFRTEGKQPTEWTHIDSRIVKHICKKFGKKKSLKSFPNLSIYDMFKYEFIYKIKINKPLYYLDYDKEKAKKIITEKYNWQDYGGHHHESILTRFIIGFWLPQKFGIDKRKITFSAQVRSGYRNRNQALQEIKDLPYDKKKMQEDKINITKRLGFSKEEFEDILNSSNKSFRDFPSNYKFYQFITKHTKFVYKMFGTKPMIAFELPSYKIKK